MGTIVNDDTPPMPTVTVASVTVAEGSSGTTQVRLVFQLDVAPTAPVSVGYITVDATATAGSDYVAASGTVTFAAGQTTAEVLLTVTGDPAYVPNEQFTVQ